MVVPPPRRHYCCVIIVIISAAVITIVFGPAAAYGYYDVRSRAGGSHVGKWCARIVLHDADVREAKTKKKTEKKKNATEKTVKRAIIATERLPISSAVVTARKKCGKNR